MPESTQPPRVFEIDCPNCGERLTTRADNAGKRIHCPVCNDQLTVTVRTSERLPDDLGLTIEPPRTFAPTSRPKAPPEIPLDDSFLDVASSDAFFPSEGAPDAPPASPFSPVAANSKAATDEEDDDTYALAPPQVLPAAPPPTAYVRARAQVDLEEAARRAAEERSRPRGPAASPGSGPPSPPRRDGANSAGDYSVEPVAPPSSATEEPLAYRRAKENLERQEAEMPQALSVPPPWPFVNGVLTYPWTRDLLLAWGVAAAGALAVGAAFQLGVAMMSGGLLMIVSVFCFIIVASAGLLTLTYLATFGLAIVENSASGLDEIASAPDTTMVERFKPTAFVMFVAWVATLPGFALGYIVLGMMFSISTKMIAVPTLLVAFLLFPVLLLSTLETDSIVQLLAPRIVRSLRENWRLWLRFYAASGALILFGLGLAGGLFLIPFAGPFLAAPLFAAVPLIYARMIGRLSWLASYAADEPAAPSRRQGDGEE